MKKLLVITAGILMAVSAWLDSTVYNENGRLASGLRYLRTGDYSSFHVNPPLTSLVGAMPSFFAGAKYATHGELGISPFARDEYRAGSLFVEKNPHYRILLFTGRFCCIGSLLLCFWLAFPYSERLYGVAAGYVFIGIFLFSPFVLGHGHLIAPDAASGMFALLSVYRFWRWLREPNGRNALIAGVALGLAELTKFTLLIFYPLFPILWLIYRFPTPASKSSVPWRRQFLRLLMIFAVSLLVINMGYFFEGTGKQLRNFRFQTTLLTGCPTHLEIPHTGGNRFNGSGNIAETALGWLPMPLPENFIQGIDTQRLDFERGLPSYLRGEWSDRGWWYYYLYALLLKNPLGTIGLFLLAAFCTFFLKGYRTDWRDEAVLLLPGVVLLVFVSSQTGFSIHSRYVIPALPFFFLWSSKTARAFTPEVGAVSPKSSRAVRTLAVVLLIWGVASSLWVYPHSIAYFNELAAVLPTPEDRSCPRPEPKPLSAGEKIHRLLDAGPLNGPRHLLDSNVDWGQDLYRLERWCAKRSEIDRLIPMTWEGKLLDLIALPRSKSPKFDRSEPQWYAVSVNRLYNRDGDCRGFLNFTPETVIGYTTCIYHISPDELDRAKNRDLREEDKP